MNILKRIWNKWMLMVSEHSWGLYDKIPEFNIVYVFTFIDQINAGGHHSTAIMHIDGKVFSNSIAVINLNKCATSESVIDVMLHEDLHIAINNCLNIGSYSKFIEKVISEWITNTRQIRSYADGSAVQVQRIK